VNGDVERIRVVGIDYSVRSIDFVAIPYDTDEDESLDDARWRRVELPTESRVVGERDLARLAIAVRERLAGELGWDSVRLTFIEKPYNNRNGRTLATLSVLEGAIAASLPIHVRRGAVNELAVTEWKTLLCGHGHASKDEVRAHVERLGLPPGLSQDACDAAAIAWAGRHLNLEAERRARERAEWMT
jgi:Holliday junction resolvasome RuvABC endonuclease subunit